MVPVNKKNILSLLRILSRPLPDSLYLKLMYRHKTDRNLNLVKPVLFNEKIQWLKLYDRDPDYISMADKYEVRKYVSKTIGEEYLIPIFGIWDSFDVIPLESLPDQFVIKCTHDSGGIFICKDKRHFNRNEARNFFINRLNKNFYWHYREWVYKSIKPRIIAEKLMVDESGNQLKDYKIFCFNGEPRVIQVDIDRFSEHKINFYSLDWEILPFEINHPSAPNITIPKPQSLGLMLELAKKLSMGKIHVRVDMHIISDRVYFGELTFYSNAGYEQFNPPEWNRIFGDWMTLPIN
jgi:hypothetical protein